MRNLLYITLLSTVFTILGACSPTPADYAEQSRNLHHELSAATNRADSDSIYHEIAVVESEARANLKKTEFKEYARLAHPQQ